MFKNQKELIRNQIFTASFEQRFFALYRKIFSIKEIEESSLLQWVFGATLFSFFITFQSWIGSSGITTEAFLNNDYVCWPWFQGCGEWYFLSALPYGYSQTIFYMAIFGAMVLITYLMWRRDWVLAHLLTTVLFLWKALVMLVLTYGMAGNYDYYHLVFAFVLLFLPLKIFFLKLTLVLFYFLASTIKFHEGWVLGTYFSALKTGLPIFPDGTIPFWTNMVIFMQVIGSWFLLSSNKVLQRTALFFFVTFHLYSGTIVQFHYPAIVLPTLLILFGPMYTHQKVPLNKKAIAGWSLVAVLFILQLSSVVIPGDEKITLEGNKYGLYMFEANHQCKSLVSIYDKEGEVYSFNRESSLSRHRCDPYKLWFSVQQICKRSEDNIDHVEIVFDHSINGGPFYRIVDEQNACDLEYKALQHNEWIKTPKEGAEIIGYPVKNIYR
ncbi:hypothetical protein HQ403_01235 [Candidatus Kaiserbacteria bacterium]|nr:hypothetical protein [Candidatus Kaiserbacteria bacterium]